jgi:hypothetical protein
LPGDRLWVETLPPELCLLFQFFFFLFPLIERYPYNLLSQAG